MKTLPTQPPLVKRKPSGSAKTAPTKVESSTRSLRSQQTNKDKTTAQKPTATAPATPAKKVEPIEVESPKLPQCAANKAITPAKVALEAPSDISFVAPSNEQVSISSMGRSCNMYSSSSGSDFRTDRSGGMRPVQPHPFHVLISEFHAKRTTPQTKKQASITEFLKNFHKQMNEVEQDEEFLHQKQQEQQAEGG